MSATVRFREWVQTPSATEHTGEFLIEDGSYFFLVHVTISLTAYSALRAGPNGIEVSEDLVKAALLRFGMRRVEQGYSTGLYEDAFPSEIHEIRVLSTDVDFIRSLLAEKTCDYQVRDRRDLYCLAASPSDETAIGTSELRTIAPTSMAVCKECDLPDTDIICSDLVHPRVWGHRVGGVVGIPGRGIHEATCNIGRPEIGQAQACRADGHACWKRRLEHQLPEAVPVPPLALPEALDALDTAWRLAFDRQPLMDLRSATDSAGLVLPCTSREDFEARLSDVDDVMKSFTVADGLIEGDKPSARETLNRVRAALDGCLDEVDLPRVDDALATLRAVNRLRVGFQHSDSADEIPGAYLRLGVSSPPEDWHSAWEIVRSRTTAALRSLTEIVRAIATQGSF